MKLLNAFSAFPTNVVGAGASPPGPSGAGFSPPGPRGAGAGGKPPGPRGGVMGVTGMGAGEGVTGVTGMGVGGGGGASQGSFGRTHLPLALHQVSPAATRQPWMSFCPPIWRVGHSSSNERMHRCFERHHV